MNYDIYELFGLNGQVAVVTGGAGGIGYEIVKGLADAGAHVTVADIDRKEITDDGRIGFIKTDVTDEASVSKTVKEIIDRHGRIDILVNCAGVVYMDKAEDFDVDKWQFVMDVNVKGTMIPCKIIGGHMISNKKGRIVNFSSVRGLQGKAGYLGYAASKGAVNMLTKTLAVEWAPHGVNVNAIAPIFTLTDLNRKILDDEKTYEWVISRLPKGRLGQKRDLVGPVIFLCSQASEFVTGEILYTDGGWTAG